jgi:predicted lipid-binding transport protein (Tim44 family)
MIAALLLQIAVALCITVPNTAVVLVFISLSGVTKGLFDPSALGLQRAVFVDATVRQRQVFATFVELNWGLSSLVGVPLCGLLLGVDFRAPFWAVAAAVAAMLPCLVLVLRGVGDLHADGAGKRRRTTNTDAVGRRAAHAKDGRVGHADGAAAAAAAAAAAPAPAAGSALSRAAGAPCPTSSTRSFAPPRWA